MTLKGMETVREMSPWMNHNAYGVSLIDYAFELSTKEKFQDKQGNPNYNSITQSLNPTDFGLKRLPSPELFQAAVIGYKAALRGDLEDVLNRVALAAANDDYPGLLKLNREYTLLSKALQIRGPTMVVPRENIFA